MAVNMQNGRSKYIAARHQEGFTFVAVLAAMLLIGLGTQKVMFTVSQQSQRDREAELIKVGTEMAQAIGAYYESSPGTVKRWPVNLQDLTDDKRFVAIRRHLRRVYLDPMTRGEPWGLVRNQDGGIRGVYSQSDASPIRSVITDIPGMNLSAAKQYADWKFIYTPSLSQERVRP
jgi:type II secretory pathway pseudopilin PulG